MLLIVISQETVLGDYRKKYREILSSRTRINFRLTRRIRKSRRSGKVKEEPGWLRLFSSFSLSHTPLAAHFMWTASHFGAGPLTISSISILGQVKRVRVALPLFALLSFSFFNPFLLWYKLRVLCSCPHHIHERLVINNNYFSTIPKDYIIFNIVYTMQRIGEKPSHHFLREIWWRITTFQKWKKYKWRKIIHRFIRFILK